MLSSIRGYLSETKMRGNRGFVGRRRGEHKDERCLSVGAREEK